jgi:hypothetical protein
MERKMKKIIFLLLVSCQLSVVNAQRLSNVENENKETYLSGSLSLDSKVAYDNSKVNLFYDSDNTGRTRKTPLLAAALSFAVPGAGEFYLGSYLKSAIFLAIEATAITVGLIYDKKGDDQTVVFENFANQNWDVKRYAKWTVANINYLKEGININDYAVFDQNGNVNWNELNRLESAIGGYYSHRLAPYKDQQYYEMIGKYAQFNVGWNDFGDENTPFSYGDPLTEKFKYYSHERGKANDFYNIASKAVLVIVINHFISAVDAAWTASRYNKNLELSAQLKKFEIGYNEIYYPQLNLKYNF